MPELIRKKKKMSSFEMIAFGFAGVILLGAIILMLPISSSAGVVTPFENFIYCDISCLRDRTCGRGYRKLLVSVWPGSDLASDPDRRIGSYYCGCIFFNGFREKDLVNAAEYDAGCDFSTESRWNCPAYEIYSTGNISDRTDRCHSHASCILQGLWMERNLDVSLPFGIGFLQCRF